MHIDPALYDFCTPRQREILETIERTGSGQQAAAALGVNKSYINRAVQAVKLKAAQKGYAPGSGVDHPVAEGFSLKGYSHFAKTANGDRIWLKADRDKDDDENALLEAIEERAQRIHPLPPIPVPQFFGPDDLFNQISIFDGHVGAHAWGRETGSGNWDLKIAREHLTTSACWLIDNLPAARDCLVLIGGDFTEVDGYKNLTPEHGHLLDADGRYPRIFEVAEEVIEAVVCHALKRHRHVTLCLRPGNHDKQTIFSMRRVFMRVFKENPRVTVDESLLEYWAMLFGNTMIACQHGDKVKLEQLPGIFAADFARMWGEATYRVCHTGHWHHEKTIQQNGREMTGMTVYQHPTMERRNAWAAGKGLIAARQLVGHSYHRAGALVTQLHFNAGAFLE